MKLTLVIVGFAVIIGLCVAEDYLNTPVHECVRCLCHAVSGCFRRPRCAQYSITKDYWMEASSPVVDDDDDPTADSSFKKCMVDENCIVETIFKYTELHKTDCNCDGTFDCKDRLAIHLMGPQCINPRLGQVRANRFNNCTRVFPMEEVIPMEAQEIGCDREEEATGIQPQ